MSSSSTLRQVVREGSYLDISALKLTTTITMTSSDQNRCEVGSSSGWVKDSTIVRSADYINDDWIGIDDLMQSITRDDQNTPSKTGECNNAENIIAMKSLYANIFPADECFDVNELLRLLDSTPDEFLLKTDSITQNYQNTPSKSGECDNAENINEMKSLYANVFPADECFDVNDLLRLLNNTPEDMLEVDEFLLKTLDDSVVSQSGGKSDNVSGRQIENLYFSEFQLLGSK